MRAQMPIIKMPCGVVDEKCRVAANNLRNRYDASDVKSVAAGMVFFLGALLLSTIFDASIKYLVTQISALFLNALRYLTYTGVGVVVLLRGGIPRWHDVNCRGMLVLRGTCLGLAGTCFLMALIWMPLGEATAIFFTSPLIVLVLARWWLREQVDWRKWMAVLVGFMGMLLMVRPGSALPTPGVLLVLGAAVSFGGYMLLTRWLATQGVAGHIQFGSTALVALIITSLPVPFFWPQTWPSIPILLLAIGVCVISAAGHLLLIAAFQRVEASTLAPLNYVQLILAVIFSIALFGAIPDAFSAVGMMLIAVAGLFVVLQRRRPRVRRNMRFVSDRER